jgi:hypothetical protein
MAIFPNKTRPATKGVRRVDDFPEMQAHIAGTADVLAQKAASVEELRLVEANDWAAEGEAGFQATVKTLAEGIRQGKPPDPIAAQIADGLARKAALGLKIAAFDQVLHTRGQQEKTLADELSRRILEEARPEVETRAREVVKAVAALERAERALDELREELGAGLATGWKAWESGLILDALARDRNAWEVLCEKLLEAGLLSSSDAVFRGTPLQGRQ